MICVYCKDGMHSECCGPECACPGSGCAHLKRKTVKRPLFSILHTSARPDKWRVVYDEWMRKAVHPEDVEYVLVVDPRWGFDLQPWRYDSRLDNILVEQNTGRRCYVDGVNIAARASSGSILIVNADDQFPCEQWDMALAQAQFLGGEFVIEVDCGGREHERRIMPMPILSRARYEKLGYVFVTEYESMSADNDFYEAAYHDGVVIDARHLLFPHKHPLYENDWKGTGKDPRWDAAYQAQNRREASELGRAIFERRKSQAFQPAPNKRLLALCLPGELFQGAYLDAVMDLQAHLFLNHPEFDLVRLRSQTIRKYTSNPYITREDMRRALAGMNPHPDLVWWQDDDNPVSPAQFEQLLAGLDAHPEIDGVSGWCWIHNEHKAGFMPSVGMWAPDYLHWDPFPPSFANRQGLEPFETSGLPVILMRYSALEKAQQGALDLGHTGAFLPLIDSRYEHGMSGEDHAFFRHAEEGGAKFLVDPQVRVPHLKYVSVEPSFPEEGLAPVKVACMMRVKNEARWIQRTIDSVRELCGDLIFVMEDGSTDGTREICERAGAIVLPSPFEGQGLGEARDKDWLLAQVMERCNPDWIFMPDGDEELQAGGAAKLLHALRLNPPVDCFALRFLYLWDSIDHIRVDGMYGTLQRQSLFRADSKFRFQSIYSEDQTPNQNHVGLHCSNAPGLGGRVMGLNVALLHYGYLHRSDRIQKYRWILTIDPQNEMEDFYRHCVQGDLPEFPADAKFRHGGPLKLSKLPPHLVPRFPDGVPGPRELVESWATGAAAD